VKSAEFGSEEKRLAFSPYGSLFRFCREGRGRRHTAVTETKTKRKEELPSPEEVRDKEVLSPEELATVLGCGRTIAYRILAEKHIRSFRVGRLRRVRRADVDTYIEQRLAASEK
jgi:excisionase family DNA binding protein